MKIYNIIDGLYLSSAIDNYNELEKNRIDYVINIRSEQHDDVYELTKRKIGYFWIPVSDGLCPTREQIFAFLHIKQQYHNANILVHCAQGRGRSAMMIMCYMKSHHNMKLEEIIKYVTDIKSDVSITDIQKDKLTKF